MLDAVVEDSPKGTQPSGGDPYVLVHLESQGTAATFDSSKDVAFGRDMTCCQVAVHDLRFLARTAKFFPSGGTCS